MRLIDQGGTRDLYKSTENKSTAWHSQPALLIRGKRAWSVTCTRNFGENWGNRSVGVKLGRITTLITSPSGASRALVGGAASRRMLGAYAGPL